MVLFLCFCSISLYGPFMCSCTALCVYLCVGLLYIDIVYCTTVLHCSLYVAASWRNNNNKLVRPRWPYDMRPSVRAEKYMCVIVIR